MVDGERRSLFGHCRHRFSPCFAHREITTKLLGKEQESDDTSPHSVSQEAAAAAGAVVGDDGDNDVAVDGDYGDDYDIDEDDGDDDFRRRSSRPQGERVHSSREDSRTEEPEDTNFLNDVVESYDDSSVRSLSVKNIIVSSRHGLRYTLQKI